MTSGVAMTYTLLGYVIIITRIAYASMSLGISASKTFSLQSSLLLIFTPAGSSTCKCPRLYVRDPVALVIHLAQWASTLCSLSFWSSVRSLSVHLSYTGF